jgi:tetratricopeptide (TPR) repeat protein
VAAALLESELETAQKSVKYLVDRQLLELAEPDRYRFHDLVRLFARGQLAQEEPAEARQAARLRASRWYVETSLMMDLALNPETRRQLAQVLGKGKAQSLEVIEERLFLAVLNWFEIERINLLASIEWAYQAQEWEMVVNLARNLVNFFNAYGYWSDWERTHLLALEATRKLGNLPDGDLVAFRYQEAQTLTNLGNVHSLQSNWGKARECYEKALGIFGELAEGSEVARILGNLGNVYSRQDYWEKASDCYQQSLDRFRELSDRYGAGQTLANMGILYMQQGDQEQAVVLWQEARALLSQELPKSQRVAQWLQSVKGPTADGLPQTSESPFGRRLFWIFGGLLVVVAIALLLLLMVW